jgi:hypothetical protein
MIDTVAVTGDVMHRIGPRGARQEGDARLVARTFDTLTESIARFQREAALRDRPSG